MGRMPPEKCSSQLEQKEKATATDTDTQMLSYSGGESEQNAAPKANAQECNTNAMEK